MPSLSSSPWIRGAPPERVLKAHSTDKVAHLFGNLRSAPEALFTKRLEQGVFLWPSNVEPGETLALSSAQLSMLIDGVDWRAPERRWRPAVAG
jgi:transposase